MKWTLTKEVEKYFKKSERRLENRFRAGLDRLPYGDVRKLEGKVGHYRLRIGDYRLLYQRINGDEVLVYHVSSRGDVYKGG